MDNRLINEIIKYLHDALGVTAVIEPWGPSRDLPFYLKDQYEFCQTRIAALPCLLIVNKGKQESSPALVRKHIDSLQPKADGREIIYVQRRVSFFNRKRLMERKVSFIIPGNQMYLLPLGLDFREYFKSAETQPAILSFPSQVVILHALLQNQQGPVWLADLAVQHGYSVMTMSRALSEIEALGLADVTLEGRKRKMTLSEARRDVWEKASGFLRNPVTRRLYLDTSIKIQDGICAGLSALALYSTLAEPGHQVRAVSPAQGKALMRDYQPHLLSVDDPDADEIEVWGYDPGLFESDGGVDRLSLFLSLRDEKDERVEGALEEMIKGMSW